MQGRRLYVGNLNYSVTDYELRDMFSVYGDVTDIKVIEGKGFAFVEMSSSSEAEAAKEKLHNTDFKGRSLNVDEAKPPRKMEDRGGYAGRRY